jgi:hypothetical protein
MYALGWRRTYDGPIGKAEGKWGYRQYLVFRGNLDPPPSRKTGLTTTQIEQFFEE